MLLLPFGVGVPGSFDHDGEEVFDAFRCRRCVGAGRVRR